MRETIKRSGAFWTHRDFTSAGYSASSVEKYHYPMYWLSPYQVQPDFLSRGSRSLSKERGHGVPLTGLTAQGRYLMVCIFSCQGTRKEPLFWRAWNSPFTCSHWERDFWGVFFKKVEKLFWKTKNAYTRTRIDGFKLGLHVLSLHIYNCSLNDADCDFLVFLEIKCLFGRKKITFRHLFLCWQRNIRLARLARFFAVQILRLAKKAFWLAKSGNFC